MKVINGYEIAKRDGSRKWSAFKPGVGGVICKSKSSAIAWAKGQGAA